MHDQILPTPEGLLRCLQALAEEAASIGLTRTYLAMQQAIKLCGAEALLPRSATQIEYIGQVH